MTIRLIDLVNFINSESSKTTRLALNTPLKSIIIKNPFAKIYIPAEKCNFILEKHVDSETGTEFVDLVFEEKEAN